MGRDRAFQTRAVVVLPPDTPDKDRLRRFGFPPQDLDGTIDASKAALAPEQLDALLQKLLVPAP